MKWTLSETIALASEHCGQCQGFGMYRTPAGNERPCECVLREIFRLCYERFQDCQILGHQLALSPMGEEVLPINVLLNHRKCEDYIADFCQVSRRALRPDHHRAFRYHFLLGADVSLCCRYLKIGEKAFYSIIRTIEQRLGRVFRELKPYSLFPLDEYFGVSVSNRGRDPRIEAFLRATCLPGCPGGDGPEEDDGFEKVA